MVFPTRALPRRTTKKADVIADVTNGVMKWPRQLLDRPAAIQRPVRRAIFWEIKNGKITRRVTDVTYNAITTDFWGNLDGVTGPNEYQKFGTGGDARGQPTQTNSISHGSPWLLIRKVMVRAAFD